MNLAELNQRIQSLNRDTAAVERHLFELEAERDHLTAQALLKVSRIKDENGKPAYSNEKIRDAAATEMLMGNNRFIACQREILKAREGRNSARGAIAAAEREWRIQAIEYEYEKLGPRSAVA